jgi:hypothetical protein
VPNLCHQPAAIQSKKKQPEITGHKQKKIADDDLSSCVVIGYLFFGRSNPSLSLLNRTLDLARALDQIADNSGDW